ncbi:hypothetical protein AVHY2522_24565 [Acidovorax sp. SUPP2522]|uniref:nuclear transport factor 2 family protein n=1 Tax=unclassified Acidovorax TaxID=2684926 RepID=UPI00234A00CD|nr:MULTISPECIES: nuclear transport factor 2 family protein [unclassified Acidovorax]WCM96608.1 nuclear transport factor 2 family protein [Acidovorax sp. GBBC 1281]GKT20019.1 hypothetical protein AVHY2522_24565 [Acidovorax sp. SUPP2522]
MTNNTQPKEHTAVLQLLHAYHEAMVAARIDVLDDLLEPGFTLTHITGYVQPRAEWLGVVRDGHFDYHHIDVKVSALSLHLAGSTAELHGRGVFDATINGMKRPWSLRFKLHLVLHDRSVWRIAHATYAAH